MESEVVGSGIWSRIKPDELRILRGVVRKVLLKEGVPPELVTNRECDKWIESRFDTTIANLIRAGHGKA